MVDNNKLNLKVGIELHRQLKTSHKLFCDCPVRPQKISDKHFQFLRRLRISESEMGEVDPAALFEATRQGWIKYDAERNSSCLVEADEEPPHELNREALDIAILVCRMLNAKVVDEVHVMRKIVIDGSNTSGFQRTMVVGYDGMLEWKDGPVKSVGVQTITLEEDAARILQSNGMKEYSLDRLGIPLIEISLSPVTLSPIDIQKLAEHLGRMLKNTGKVESGLGTVRQDINISVNDGPIIEVKGVQQLDLISKVVDFEWKRQNWLNQLAFELKQIGLTERDFDSRQIDVSDLLFTVKGSWIIPRLKKGERAYAMLVPKFSGIFSKEPGKNMRLGKELADIARSFGLGGLIHSDELPSNGIEKQHVDEIMKRINAKENDGFILLIADSSKLEYVFPAIRNRLKQALKGVPAETRAATQDGETKFIRPRPGSARMYPETDIEPVRITREDIIRADSSIPEPWEKKVENLVEKYYLSKEQAVKLLDSDYLDLFVKACQKTELQPSFIASLLTEGLVSLRREGIEVQQEQMLLELIVNVSRGIIAKEASLDVLRSIGKGESKDLNEAIQKLGLKRISDRELASIIRQIIEKERKLIQEKGEKAFSPLMGMVMQEVRGRIDGSIVSKELKKAIEEELSSKNG